MLLVATFSAFKLKERLMSASTSESGRKDKPPWHSHTFSCCDFATCAFPLFRLSPANLKSLRRPRRSTPAYNSQSYQSNNASATKASRTHSSRFAREYSPCHRTPPLAACRSFSTSIPSLLARPRPPYNRAVPPKRPS